MNNRLSGINVLVTGSEGFIGSHLVERLLEEKALVFAIVHPKENLWRLKSIDKRTYILKANLEDDNRLRHLIAKIKPKKIYHLAAFSQRQDSLENAILAIRTNVLGTLNLISALKDKNYNCFINIGSSSEYGNSPTPFREDYFPRPMSFYAASKSASWLFCNTLHKRLRLPIVNLRLFLVYGPKQNADFFIPQLIISALKGEDFKMTSGEQTRDFVYVSDIVDGIIKASLSTDALGQTINLCSGLEYKLKDVANKINSLMDEQIKITFGAIPYRDNEIGHIYGDNSKAKRILNWYPQVDLDSGLKETINWYRQNLSKKK